MHNVVKLLSALHTDGTLMRGTEKLRGLSSACPVEWFLFHHRYQLQGKKVLEDLYSGLDVLNLFEERLICSLQAGWLGRDRVLT